MDVTGLLLRAGATRPHVMIAAMPGGTDVRLTAEEQVRRRGWPVALTPADADVLLVAGTAGPDIAEAVEAAWAAVPAPRALARATRPDDVAPALDAARAELASAAGQRRPAATRHRDRHGRHDSSGHHAMGRGGHGHEMADMGMPAGLPMADRAEDRDGLKLDQLHVPSARSCRTGPPGWSPG